MPKKRGTVPPPIRSKIQRFVASIWFFPVILLIPLVLLTVFKISGSSIGVYHTYLYGDTKDSSLLLGKPRTIRSDEWIVNSQMLIAQSNNNYAENNKNIGHGEDMSLLLDVPYKGWSEVFKPHNWAFLVLPFDNAFAFKWWVMAYLLVISCYFFVLAMLPGRQLLAVLLGFTLLFSAFVQWWYLYTTLGSLYYCLFIATAFIHLLRQKQKSLLPAALWGVLIAYLFACFILLLYPPFQIACALALGAFALGYLLKVSTTFSKTELLQKLSILAIAILLAGGISFAFLHSREAVVQTLQNTAYPGKRVVTSGYFDLPHLFSGHLDYQLQSDIKAAHYQISHGVTLTNQSEDSNFLLLLPFLFLPSAYIVYRDHRKRKPMDLPLLFVNAMFLLMLAWLFIPHLPIIGQVLLLSKVPLTRLLLGLGLLNIFQMVLLIRRLQDHEEELFTKSVVTVYSLLIFAFEVALGLHAKHAFPGYIGTYRVLAFSLPMPVIVYALLRKHYNWAGAGLLAFVLLIGFGVNPVYQSTAVLTKTPLSMAIQHISSANTGKWATEDPYLENFALMNGAPSLSAIYAYPQLALWRSLDDGTQTYIYNRYAHVNFNFDRDANRQIPTKLKLVGGDNFGVITEPCGSFLRNQGVRFITTEVVLNKQDRCAKLIDTVKYPTRSIFIYRLH